MTGAPRRTAAVVEGAIVIVCCAAVVMWLDPGGIVSATTPTGGDMGAHVWGPAFLRDVLLPSGSLSGWSPEWYAGMPAMQFYPVVPYLLVVALDVVLPYGVAFKLIAVSGVVSMPAAAWLMGWLSGWSRFLRALAAVALLLFVFDANFTIYGGNVASTLAGEFAFSIALSAALVFLGLLWRSLERGTGRATAALVLGLVALCHPIVLAFTIAASVVLVAVRSLHALPERIGRAGAFAMTAAGVALWAGTWALFSSTWMRMAVPALAVAALVGLDWRRSWHALVIGLLGGLVSAFWTVPFVGRVEFLNDMGWERLTTLRDHLFFPDNIGGEFAHHSITWLLALAGLGALAGLLRWNRFALTWSAIAFTMAMGFAHWPQHRLWNARILGFWYLALYLLAAIGIWLVISTLSQAAAASGRRSLGATMRWLRRGVPLAALVGALGLLALRFGDLPGGRFDDEGTYRWGPLALASDDRHFVHQWARWNFQGYERRESYPEYHQFVSAMADVGRTEGCGRLMWEYGKDKLGSYGTPMAPMLLPHWTDGCIGSLEGLYFESSETVPFHFLMQSELSEQPSKPMRDLPYGDFDLGLGISHMRMAGVAYYAAFSTTALEAANASDELTFVGWAGSWTIYRVEGGERGGQGEQGDYFDGTELVSALRYEPAVAQNASNSGRQWTDPAVLWFTDPSAWDVPVAGDGPDRWQRVEVLAAPNAPGAGAIREQLSRFSEAERRPLPAVEVSNVVAERERVSFTVDELGVPVMVKVSYFPNWSASGADGPYRVTPNWMLVVPTQNDVTLSYGATWAEYLGWLLTWLGLALAALVGLRPPIKFDRRRSEPPPSAQEEDAQELAPIPQPEPELEPQPPPELEPDSLPTISVIIPAYRAVHLVGTAVAEVRAALSDHLEGDGLEIVVVDDGSADGTADAARAAGADMVLGWERNRGKGAAVREGMLAARGRLRLFTDVDLAYAPGQLVSLVSALEGDADVALGNRRHAEAHLIRAPLRSRAIASRVFNAFIRLVLLHRYRDTQCGFKGFTAEAATEIFGRSVIDGFTFDVEVLYLVEHLELQAVEVPVTVDHATDTTVRFGRVARRVLRDVWRIRRRAVRGAYDELP